MFGAGTSAPSMARASVVAATGHGPEGILLGGSCGTAIEMAALRHAVTSIEPARPDDLDAVMALLAELHLPADGLRDRSPSHQRVKGDSAAGSRSRRSSERTSRARQRFIC